MCPYLVLVGVDLPLAVGELHGFVAVLLQPDDSAVREDALLGAVREDVLDRLVRERDFLRAVWVHLLRLTTAHTHKVMKHCNHNTMKFKIPTKNVFHFSYIAYNL